MESSKLHGLAREDLTLPGRVRSWLPFFVYVTPRSGGYDLNLFTSTLDCSFLCSVCRGVLKRPVRLPCAHTFCKKCILQWLARQKTCPCCRKEVKRRKLVHVSRLRRSIGRLEVKCKNAEAGCLVTCPLARRREHQDSCPFELTACPNEGCTAQVLRGALADHQLHCLQSARQLCPLGCGATVGPAERAGHNCYRELRDAWSARQERSRALLLRLLHRLRQVHRTTSLIRRQLAQLGNFLEEDDILLAGTSQGAEATPGSRSGAQGQSTL